MKYMIFVAALILGASCQLADDANRINPPNCGRRLSEIDPSSPSKVVGGTDAVLGDWGWQVSMNYSGRFICGGSLINSQWILTAAHCVSSLSASFYSYDIGHHDRRQLESWAVTRKVKQVVKHPNYSAARFTNDIALMKLSEPITYVKEIVPVCIPNGQVDYSGRDSWGTGWGTLFSGGSVSRYLQEVKMPFLSDARCRQKFGSAADVSVMVCAGETGEGKDTCQGDSGGPLTVKHIPSDPSNEVFDDADNNAQPAQRWYNVGITSWGYGCGDGGVYTRTTNYYNWIKQILRQYAD